MTRVALQRLHRWIGLALALPLIVLAVTGFIMAATPFAASMAGVPSANGPLVKPADLRNVDATAILAAARAAVPAGLVPRRWRAQPGAVVLVDFAAMGSQGIVAQVAMDAAATKVLWVRQEPDGFYRWVHSVHETFLLGPPGRGAVGWIGIGLLLLALSGIPLWWPPRGRWKAAFGVAHGVRGWRFQRDLHGAAGIWMVGLLLVQSVSGVALAFPQTARAIAGLPSQAPRGGGPSGETQTDPVHLITIAMVSARAAMPQASLQDLRLPAVPGRPVTAFLLPSGAWQGSPLALVTMDPVTARVLSVQDPGADSPRVSVLNWLRAVHEGGAAGPAGRLLMCLFALALPVFPVTGIAMWLLRWQRRRRFAAKTVGVYQ